MDAGEFMIEAVDTAKRENARVQDVKGSALKILSSAKKVYEKLKQGHGNPAFLTGKAWAYLAAFKAMARALEINPDHYMPVVNSLEEKLTAFVNLHEEPPPSKTVVIQHKADPDKVKVEERKLDIRESTKEEEPTGIKRDVENALVELGFKRDEARRRAGVVYMPGIPIESLIAGACRVG